MKKIKKNELRLEKEVISALTESDLGNVKGGADKTIKSCLGCPQPSHPISYVPADCRTVMEASCMVSQCVACNTYANCVVPFTDNGEFCKPVLVSNVDGKCEVVIP